MKRIFLILAILALILSVFPVQPADGFEDFSFGLEVEPVAAFAFERGGAVGGEFGEPAAGLCRELARGGAAKTADGREDSAAAAGDLLVGCPGDALLVLVGAAGGEDEVRVRVDEAGQDDVVAGVDFSCAPRQGMPLDGARGADGFDAAAGDEHGGVAEDSQLAQLAPAARSRGSS